MLSEDKVPRNVKNKEKEPSEVDFMSKGSIGKKTSLQSNGDRERVGGMYFVIEGVHKEKGEYDKGKRIR